MSRRGTLSAKLHSSFIGREEEMSEIKGHLKESMNGNGGLVLIVGEMGIGKTRLLEELGRYAESKGVRYLRGRGLYQENARPYLPFIEAFGEYLSNGKDLGDIDIRAYVAGESDDVLSMGLLPLSQDDESEAPIRNQDLNIQEKRDRLFEWLYRLVIDLSEKRPLLLVLDDLQWADESSLQLLHYLARNIRNTKVLVCGAYCPEDLQKEGLKAHFSSETIRRMRIEKLFLEIPLARLNERNTVLMIESLVGDQGLPKEFTKKLYQESEGNPFFIEEVLKSLVNEGLIDVDSYRWDVKIDVSQIRIPGTIRDVTARRIDRLDNRTKKVLKFASAIGNSFMFELLYRIYDSSEEEVVDAIDASLAANIIHEDAASNEERYRFNHALIREVVYDSMSKSRKRLVHKRIGHTIEDLYKDRIDDFVYNLAHHFHEAKDAKKSLVYAIKAGDKAEKTFAPEDALKYYRYALDTMGKIKGEEETMPSKLKAVAKIGEIHNILGDWDLALKYQQQALELSGRLKDDLERAKAYRNQGHIKQNQGEYDSALDCFKKGLDISETINDIHGMADTYRGLGRVFWRKGEFENAIEFFEWSLGLTKKIKDERVMARTCIELGNVYSELGQWEKAIEYQTNSLKLLEKLNDYYELGRSHNNLGVTYARKGDTDIALEHYEKSIQVSDKTGNIRMVGWALFNAAEAYARLGQFEKALDSCNKSLSIFERLDEKLGISGAYMSYGIIFKLRKQWDKAISYFDESMRIRKELEMPYRLADGYFEFALLYKEKGDYQKALECLNKAQEILKKLGAKEFLGKVKIELKSINVMK